MGIEILDKIIFDSNLKFYSFEDYPNISTLIIPFSAIIEHKTNPDIYTGKEKIPFKEKDSEFKQILLNEFFID